MCFNLCQFLTITTSVPKYKMFSELALKLQKYQNVLYLETEGVVAYFSSLLHML
jgi:hypothetical protein